MGLIIEDAGGRGHKAKVSGRNRLNVESISNVRGFYISRDDELCFNLNSHDATAAATTHIIYLKNTSSTRLLYVDLVRMGGVASILWKVWKVTGTATGTTITPTNLNLSSGIAAEATCLGNDAVGGLTQGVQVANARSAANSSVTIPFDDTLILGQNDAIAVEADAVTSTDVAEGLIRFYYEKPGND